MRQISKIIIHCSASPNGMWHDTTDIDRWHVERGFRRAANWRKLQNHKLSAIGYHFVIYTNGAIATGRALGEIGAHCQGYNADSIGVCLVGTDKFSRAQWDGLKANITTLRKYYPTAQILGHRDLNADKACPCFSVSDWLACGMVALPGHVLGGV